MDENSRKLILRGKDFSDSQINLIQAVNIDNFQLGRTKISQIICEKLNWRQPNGWLKERACRDVLRILDERGIISLPPPLTKAKKQSTKRKTEYIFSKRLFDEFDSFSSIEDFPLKIDLINSKGNQYEQIWNYLVATYHYLGHQVTVGRNIKYLIAAGNQLLGAISFSSPSWQLEPRDILLKKLGITNPGDYTINNSRFLILPNVNVKNLASLVLSKATKQVVIDWYQYYSISPLIAETFVQPSLYDGTCYKAANWQMVGKTRGFAKKGTSHHNSQEPKIIFLYGLNKEIRRQLAKMVLENKNGNL